MVYNGSDIARMNGKQRGKSTAVRMALTSVLVVGLLAVSMPASQAAPPTVNDAMTDKQKLKAVDRILGTEAVKKECDGDPGCRAGVLLAHIGTLPRDLNYDVFTRELAPFTIKALNPGTNPVGLRPEGHQLHDWPLMVSVETSQGNLKVADVDLSHRRVRGGFDYDASWDAPEGTQTAFLERVKAGYKALKREVARMPKGEERTKAIREALGLDDT